MKILIAGFSKIKYMPYINFYLDNLDKNNNDIHILYWNRDMKSEDLSSYKNYNLHEFRYYQEDDISKILKVKSFIKYKQTLKKIINYEKIDFIIILHSLPGVLINNFLKKKYKNKYIFDYRDLTYEKNYFYKNIIWKLVKNSKYTFVSSDGFRKYLPKEYTYKTFTSHNLLIDSLNHRDDKQLYNIESKKIRISFWGFIRHVEINKQIIEKISNDLRFELHYYGREQKEALSLKEFAKQLKSTNVFFHGEYTPKQRYEFIKSTDIIHNIYFDQNMMLAMSNKYYDGIIFKIPQLCLKGSFMAEKVESSNVGLVVDINDKDFTNRIFSFYKNINYEKFYECCDNELSIVKKEYDKGIIILQKLK